MNQEIKYKSGTGQVNIDEATGIVECFVAGIGNKDSVGDIVISGAFAKSLTRRKPRVVWGHSWNDPIGKVLEMYEVPLGDPRLPAKMRDAGVGGLYAKVQFNLNSEKGKEAFASVAFFGEDQEWSIGYKTLDSIFDANLQANVLKEVELYEVSPVLHGANHLTGTISIKHAEETPLVTGNPFASMLRMISPEQMPRIIAVPASTEGEENGEEDIFSEGLAQKLSKEQQGKIQQELSERTNSQVEIISATEGSLIFKRTEDSGKTSTFRVGYHTPDNYETFMFGKPEAYTSVVKPEVEQNIVTKPNPDELVVVPNAGAAYRNDDEDEMSSLLDAVSSSYGKSAVTHLIELPQYAIKDALSMLEPVFQYHKLETYTSDKGIGINGVVSAQAMDALQTAVKAIGQTIGQTAGTLRTIAQGFNPNAIDGDADGFAQDNTAFMRPYIPIKKPNVDLPDVGGKKRNATELLDKPTIDTGPKSTVDPATLAGQPRQRALAAGTLQPRTREDMMFLADRRPLNAGLAKYWDMNDSELNLAGQRLLSTRRSTGAEGRDAVDTELYKVSHEFARRTSYEQQFGKKFVPPKSAAAPTKSPVREDAPKPVTKPETIAARKLRAELDQEEEDALDDDDNYRDSLDEDDGGASLLDGDDFASRGDDKPKYSIDTYNAFNDAVRDLSELPMTDEHEDRISDFIEEAAANIAPKDRHLTSSPFYIEYMREEAIASLLGDVQSADDPSFHYPDIADAWIEANIADVEPDDGFASAGKKSSWGEILRAQHPDLERNMVAQALRSSFMDDKNNRSRILRMNDEDHADFNNMVRNEAQSIVDYHNANDEGNVRTATLPDHITQMIDKYEKSLTNYEPDEGLGSRTDTTPFDKIDTEFSGALDGAHYDAQNQELHVGFKRTDGPTSWYTYSGVTQKEVDALHDSNSKGREINKIKGKHDVEKARPETIDKITSPPKAKSPIEPIDVADSKALASAHYDSGAQELVVTYNGPDGEPGGTYIYEGVTQADADAFDSAPSKGRAINEIKRTKAFRKANADEVETRESAPSLDWASADPDDNTIESGSGLSYEIQEISYGGEFNVRVGKRTNSYADGPGFDEIEESPTFTSREAAQSWAERYDHEVVLSEQRADKLADGRTEKIDVSRSSALEKASWNDRDQELTVKYRGGGTYVYEGVTEDDFDDLNTAKSKGAAINRIKKTHTFRKADEGLASRGDGMPPQSYFEPPDYDEVEVTDDDMDDYFENNVYGMDDGENEFLTRYFSGGQLGTGIAPLDTESDPYMEVLFDKRPDYKTTDRALVEKRIAEFQSYLEEGRRRSYRANLERKKNPDKYEQAYQDWLDASVDPDDVGQYLADNPEEYDGGFGSRGFGRAYDEPPDDYDFNNDDYEEYFFDRVYDGNGSVLRESEDEFLTRYFSGGELGILNAADETDLGYMEELHNKRPDYKTTDRALAEKRVAEFRSYVDKINTRDAFSNPEMEKAFRDYFNRVTDAADYDDLMEVVERRGGRSRYDSFGSRASTEQWPTPYGDEPSEFNTRETLSQIGRGNLGAISGGRTKMRGNEMVLPVNKDQQVIVGYNGGADTYYVRAEKIINSGKDKGKNRVLAQWNDVYAEDVGETAYNASLRPEYLSDDNKTFWEPALSGSAINKLVDKQTGKYYGADDDGFASRESIQIDENILDFNELDRDTQRDWLQDYYEEFGGLPPSNRNHDSDAAEEEWNRIAQKERSAIAEEILARVDALRAEGADEGNPFQKNGNILYVEELVKNVTNVESSQIYEALEILERFDNAGEGFASRGKKKWDDLSSDERWNLTESQFEEAERIRFEELFDEGWPDDEMTDRMDSPRLTEIAEELAEAAYDKDGGGFASRGNTSPGNRFDKQHYDEFSNLLEEGGITSLPVSDDNVWDALNERVMSYGTTGSRRDKWNEAERDLIRQMSSDQNNGKDVISEYRDIVDAWLADKYPDDDKLPFFKDEEPLDLDRDAFTERANREGLASRGARRSTAEMLDESRNLIEDPSRFRKRGYELTELNDADNAQRGLDGLLEYRKQLIEARNRAADEMGTANGYNGPPRGKNSRNYDIIEQIAAGDDDDWTLLDEYGSAIQAADDVLDKYRADQQLARDREEHSSGIWSELQKHGRANVDTDLDHPKWGATHEEQIDSMRDEMSSHLLGARDMVTNMPLDDNDNETLNDYDYINSEQIAQIDELDKKIRNAKSPDDIDKLSDEVDAIVSQLTDQAEEQYRRNEAFRNYEMVSAPEESEWSEAYPTDLYSFSGGDDDSFASRGTGSKKYSPFGEGQIAQHMDELETGGRNADGPLPQQYNRRAKTILDNWNSLSTEEKRQYINLADDDEYSDDLGDLGSIEEFVSALETAYMDSPGYEDDRASYMGSGGDDFASRGAQPDYSSIEVVDVSGSSALEDAYYDPEVSELIVMYPGGRIYIYEGVTQDDLAEFRDNTSKGRAINDIKRTHSFRRADEGDRGNRFAREGSDVAQEMEKNQLDSIWNRLKPEHQISYLKRVTDHAISNGSGESADDLVEAAKRRALDDREMASLERQADAAGLGGRKIDVSSSQALNSVAYDKDNRVLSVEYRGRNGEGTGKIYDYADVPESVVSDLENADSRGGVLRTIRDDYEFTTRDALPAHAYEGFGSRDDSNKPDPIDGIFDDASTEAEYQARMDARRDARRAKSPGGLTPPQITAKKRAETRDARERERVAAERANWTPEDWANLNADLEEDRGRDEAGDARSGFASRGRNPQRGIRRGRLIDNDNTLSKLQEQMENDLDDGDAVNNFALAVTEAVIPSGTGNPRRREGRGFQAEQMDQLDAIRDSLERLGIEYLAGRRGRGRAVDGELAQRWVITDADGFVYDLDNGTVPALAWAGMSRNDRAAFANQQIDRVLAGGGFNSRDELGRGGGRPKDDPLASFKDLPEGAIVTLVGDEFTISGSDGFGSRFTYGSETGIKTKDEMFEYLNAQLIEAIEQADPTSWKMPWRVTSMPNNPTTKKPYSGSNFMTLAIIGSARGYESKQWAGYGQWESAGGQVRKGAKGVPIFVPIPFKSKDKKGTLDPATGKVAERSGMSWRVIRVFNRDEVDGLPEDYGVVEALPEATRIDNLEKTLAEIAPVLNHEGSRAYYSPSKDIIVVPAFSDFKNARGYYGTVAHELMHWTGGEKRLKRANMNQFGSPEYAYEELIAEIASSMFLAAHGLEPDIQDNHAPYLANWLRVLRDDPTALPRAMKQAQEAFNYAMGLSPNMGQLFKPEDKGGLEVDVKDVAEMATPGFGSRTLDTYERASELFEDGKKYPWKSGSPTKAMEKKDPGAIKRHGLLMMTNDLMNETVGRWTTRDDDGNHPDWFVDLTDSFYNFHAGDIEDAGMDSPPLRKLFTAFLEREKPYLGEDEGFASRGRGRKGKRRAWSKEDRQRFVDGDRLRARRVPSKRRPGPSQDEDGFGSRKITNLLDDYNFDDTVDVDAEKQAAIDAGVLSPQKQRSPKGVDLTVRGIEGDSQVSAESRGRRQIQIDDGDIWVGDDGGGQSWALSKIWDTARENSLARFFRQGSSGKYELKKDTDIAAELGITPSQAAILTQPDARIRDPYLADALARRIGRDRPEAIWGADNPTAYFDESGDPITDRGRLYELFGDNATDNPPDDPRARPRGRGIARKATAEGGDINALLEEINYEGNRGQRGLLEGIGVLSRAEWRKALEGEGLSRGQVERLLKNHYPNMSKNKIAAKIEEMYGSGFGAAVPQDLDAREILAHRAFKPFRTGGKSSLGELHAALEEVTGKKLSRATLSRYVNSTVDPRSGSGPKLQRGKGLGGLPITVSQMDALLERLGIDKGEFDKFRQ